MQVYGDEELITSEILTLADIKERYPETYFMAQQNGLCAFTYRRGTTRYKFFRFPEKSEIMEELLCSLGKALIE